MRAAVEHLYEQGVLSALDLHLAKFLHQLVQPTHDYVLLSVAVLSDAVAQGNICVDLSHYAKQNFPKFPQENVTPISCPELTDWLNTLKNCAVVGRPGEFKPLILDDDHLYFYRYWQYEQHLAAQIRQHLQTVPIDTAKLADGLQRLFAGTDPLQQLAARRAVEQGFCIISGGPGTGKTSTVVRILALLLEQNPKLRIAVAAPTGKAAARLQEVMTQYKQTLNCDDAIKQAIPQHSHTIHRLLGAYDNSHFKFNADNPLPYDVIVVDEASMIDLALMTKLAKALTPSARWILLGDKDQLASVEAGTVLGDICDALGAYTGMQQNVVLLKNSYRFHEESGIGQLAAVVNAGDGHRAIQLIQQQKYSDILWHELDSLEMQQKQLVQHIMQQLEPYFSSTQPEQILRHFGQFRVLCAMRQGFYGVERINRLIEQELSARKRINLGYRWYHRCPIMITRNDYTLKLFNGDIGIILWNKNKELMTYFADSDGHIRTIAPQRLPAHETVYAMTIHKSQGSEFNNVLMLLPNQLVGLLTRELIYTGLTRAKQRIAIWANSTVLAQAIQHKISRHSGLKKRLATLDFSTD